MAVESTPYLGRKGIKKEFGECFGNVVSSEINVFPKT